jgi:hypothetical protein
VTTTRHITQPSSEAQTTPPSVLWWSEAEAAARDARVPRARRFLRWILAAQPDDQEAWLRLAELASGPEARLAYLRQAYAFHPGSHRVQAALREARTRQLEAAARELPRLSIRIRPLPGKPANAVAHSNGHDRGQKPARGGQERPGWARTPSRRRHSGRGTRAPARRPGLLGALAGLSFLSLLHRL